MTRRRWIAETWTEASATLVGAQAEHLARVLRAQPGAVADVVAGGRVFRAEVASVSLAGDASAAELSEVRFNLIAELEAEPALPVTLALAIYKFDRMEWAIEKATELGVAAIAPMVARRTEKHLAEAAAKRTERWRRIAKEAAQQARRSDVPQVYDPVPLAERVRAQSTSTPASASEATRPEVARIVLAEQERTTTLRYALDEVLAKAELAGSGARMPALELAFGPEGGWAPSEEALFDANGWRAVSLGPRILRAETAALAALAVVASYLE